MTAQAIDIPAPAVNTTTLANDLRIRVFMRSSANNTAARVDRLTFTGRTPLGATTAHDFEQIPQTVIDRASGTATTIPWSLAADDANSLTTGTWNTTPASNRYLEYTFANTPGSLVPTGATITQAQFTHTWRNNATQSLGQVCFYYQVWDSSGQIGPDIGLSTSPYTYCNTNGNATTPYTHTITLPALTVAQANQLKIRAYGRNSAGARTSQIDRAALLLTWERY